jgi:tetratricopeptide (TPR) repeat protein
MEPEERFRELHDAAVCAQAASDYRALRQLSRDIAEVGEASGDRRIVAWGDYFAGIALITNNEGAAANRALRRALGFFREHGDRVLAARTMMNLAMIEIDINLNASEARRLYEEAAPAIREEGDLKRLGILLGNLGEICRLEGDYDAALRHGHESERLFREIGDASMVVWQLVDIAHYQLLRRDYGSAIAGMRAAFEPLSRELNPRFVSLYFDVWMIVAAKLEHWDVAARLLGFVDRLRSDQNVPRLQGLLPWLSAPTERLASVMPQDRMHELFLEGEALSAESAYALTQAIAAS